MEACHTVKVLEICRVAPPPGSVPNTSLPLTFLDLFFLPLPPPQRLYFYEFPHPKTHFLDTFLPRIKHSLSLTLQHFFPLAGNLVWPLKSDKPMINYVDGDSVSLTISQCESNNFSHLSDNHPKDAIDSHHLIPNLPLSGELIPVLALQITLFPDSGICIGISTNHGAVDGKISTQFMKSWASSCKLGESSPLDATLFFDKTVIADPNGLEKIYVNELLKFLGSKSESQLEYRELKMLEIEIPPNMVRATFEFSEADIAKLKRWVTAKESFHVSSFVVTAAYVWVCLVKAQREVSNSETTSFGIAVDYRARMNPPIPSYYFGNCIGGIFPSTEKKTLLGENNGIFEATKLIQKAIKGMENGLFINAEGWLSLILTLKSGRVASSAGSPRFRVYETDFGWGKPKKVEMVSIDRTGAVSFAESEKEDGRGIEIGLVLEKEEMDCFTSVFINELGSLRFG